MEIEKIVNLYQIIIFFIDHYQMKISHQDYCQIHPFLN